jgi:hypothetical protein
MPLKACDRYSFGEFTLDVDERRFLPLRQPLREV